jgi:hypothetical protein
MAGTKVFGKSHSIEFGITSENSYFQGLMGTEFSRYLEMLIFYFSNLHIFKSNMLEIPCTLCEHIVWLLCVSIAHGK